MPSVQVREKTQITLPTKMCEALGSEAGDYLGTEVEDNKIVPVPKILVNKVKAVALPKKDKEILKGALEDEKKTALKSSNCRTDH